MVENIAIETSQWNRKLFLFRRREFSDSNSAKDAVALVADVPIDHSTDLNLLQHVQEHSNDTTIVLLNDVIDSNTLSDNNCKRHKNS